MADLVVVDHLQDGGARRVAEAVEPRDHRRCHVEAARLEHQRNHGEPRQRVVRCRLRCLPQPVMRREIAIGGTEFGEAGGHQRVVLRLLCGHGNPIVVEPARQRPIGEAGDEVPGEVDGVELDMRERVEQRDAPGDRAAGTALRHVPWWEQQRGHGTGWTVGRRAAADLDEGAAPPGGCRGSGESHLRRRLGRGKHGAGGVRQRAARRAGQSALAAASSASTWPGTLTLRHTPRTTPFSSMRKVARSIPMYFRPYMLFSTQTP